MFDVLPTQITRLRGSGDAAACVDAAVGWGRVCAAAEAQRLSAIAEFAVTFLASDRAYRIAAERARSDARVAERNTPPGF